MNNKLIDPVLEEIWDQLDANSTDFQVQYEIDRKIFKQLEGLVRYPTLNSIKYMWVTRLNQWLTAAKATYGGLEATANEQDDSGINSAPDTQTQRLQDRLNEVV